MLFEKGQTCEKSDHRDPRPIQWSSAEKLRVNLHTARVRLALMITDATEEIGVRASSPTLNRARHLPILESVPRSVGCTISSRQLRIEPIP
jgi:hypothetical protein